MWGIDITYNRWVIHGTVRSKNYNSIETRALTHTYIKVVLKKIFDSESHDPSTMVAGVPGQVLVRMIGQDKKMKSWFYTHFVVLPSFTLHMANYCPLNFILWDPMHFPRLFTNFFKRSIRRYKSFLRSKDWYYYFFRRISYLLTSIS